MTFDEWWAGCVGTDEAKGYARAAWDAALRAVGLEVLEMAARQDEFATNPWYTQSSEADRACFRHAAMMLRRAADLIAKAGGVGSNTFGPGTR